MMCKVEKAFFIRVGTIMPSFLYLYSILNVSEFGYDIIVWDNIVARWELIFVFINIIYASTSFLIIHILLPICDAFCWQHFA